MWRYYVFSISYVLLALPSVLIQQYFGDVKAWIIAKPGSLLWLVHPVSVTMSLLVGESLIVTGGLVLLGRWRRDISTVWGRSLAVLVAIVAVTGLALIWVYRIGNWVVFPSHGEILYPLRFLDIVTSVDLQGILSMAQTREDRWALAAVLLGPFAISCFLAAVSFRIDSPAPGARIGLVGMLVVAGASLGLREVLRRQPETERVAILERWCTSYSPEISAVICDQMLDDGVTPGTRVVETLKLRSPFEPFTSSKLPNVLIVMVEALRPDVLFLTVDGKEITPNMNRLAREGISFERIFAVAPETGYSQFALLTGRHPWIGPRRLPRWVGQDLTTVFEIAKSLGYRTAYVTDEWKESKYHIPSRGLDMRLSIQTDDVSLHRDILGDELVRQIQEAKARGVLPLDVLDIFGIDAVDAWLSMEPSQPSFTGLFMDSTHYPYEMAQENFPRLFEVPDERTTRSIFGLNIFSSASPSDKDRIWRSYLNLCHFVDTLLGEILTRHVGSGEDWLVVLTGDHGQEFFEHGGYAHAKHIVPETIRVPLVFWGPKTLSGMPPPAKDVLAQHLNVAPTLLQLLGQPPFPGFQRAGLFGESGASLSGFSFSTNQGLFHEDAVLHWPWLYALRVASGDERLIHLETGEEIHSGPAELLKEMRTELELFKTRQIGYYALGEERKRYFPPDLEQRLETNTAEPPRS